jgi:hypothetical protein
MAIHTETLSYLRFAAVKTVSFVPHNGRNVGLDSFKHTVFMAVLPDFDPIPP